MTGFETFTLTSMLNGVSAAVIPIVLLVPFFAAVVKKVRVYEVFVEGAKGGFTTAVQIIPYLVAMLVSIGIFRASGAMGKLVNVIQPFADIFHFPAEVIPMAMMRSLSGSGAQAMMTELITTHGADSLIGNMSSVLMGSTETTMYVLAVYFGSVSIVNGRHALPVGLLADFTSFVVGVAISLVVFS